MKNIIMFTIIEKENDEVFALGNVFDKNEFYGYVKKSVTYRAKNCQK